MKKRINQWNRIYPENKAYQKKRMYHENKTYQKKKTYLALLLSALTLCMTACTADQKDTSAAPSLLENLTEPTTIVGNQTETATSTDAVSSTSAAEAVSPAASSQTLSSASAEASEPTPKPTSEVITDVFLPSVSLSSAQKGLRETLPVSDTAKEAAQYNTFNRMLSASIDPTYSMFCVDDVTGVIYFVNQGKDYYLYRLKDGVAELAVALPVTNLYTLNGSVFFSIYPYSNILTDVTLNDIYRYDPGTGEVTLFHTPQIDPEGYLKLYVDETGVYYCDSRNKVLGYRVTFSSPEAMEDDLFMTFSGWRNYMMSYFRRIDEDRSKPAPLSLEKRKTEERKEERIELGVGRPWRYCIYGDYLYYNNGFLLGILNFETLEKTTYDLENAVHEAYRVAVRTEPSWDPGVVKFHSFSMTEGRYLWATGGYFLYRLDTVTGDITPYVGPFNGFLETLYTDGTNLYGAYTYPFSFSSTNRVVRLILPKDSENTGGVAAFEVEYLVE